MKHIFKVFVLAKITIVTILVAHTAYAQNNENPADKYLNNVVQITTIQNNVETDHGFGFIVGEQNNKYYIVTANHVVRKQNEDPDDKKEVKIQFYQNQGNYYQATLVSRVYPGVDLALIEIQKPSQSYTWNTQYADTNPINGEKVWFIGRTKAWDSPNQPGYVKAAPIGGKYRVENNNVRPGTSGAPLISYYGIQGMIIGDNTNDANYIVVLDIETIERIVSVEWNKPWGLVVNATSKNNDVSTIENPEQSLLDAANLIRNGNYSDARNKLDVIISASNTQDSPIRKDAYYWILLSYLEEGNYGKALVSVDTLAELYPDDYRAATLLINSAISAKDIGEYLHAFILLQKVKDKYPRSESSIAADHELSGLRLMLSEDFREFNANNIKDIFFGLDSSKINPDAAKVLEQNALILLIHPDISILIEGYSAIEGTPAYGLRIGLKRAYSVKTFLVSMGIDPSRLETFSGGATTQFAAGTSEEAYQLNRRAHIIVTSQHE